ncbi:MAG TPA: GPO family capsid scaffolding protein [Sphingobium sp.]|uniref:GPO family capsid scaffolding protein n=1 Tax=Sphingobium sp. TaxID=1912891 RepID=UPI002ED15E2B
MAKTKFFRIAVEGATVDGRTIERSWLEDMAAGYDPATYTARINCEHIAGYSPDRPFNAYGSVLSLKTEEVELTISGEKKTLLSLLAEIDANDQLVEINKAGQKLFTSCEIHPDFAGSGKAYLVGLAVTDTPASLGTEPLKFAAMTRSNLFTTAFETNVEFLSEQDAKSIAASVVEGLKSFFARSETEKPKDAPKPPPANDNGFDVEAYSRAIGDQIAAAITPVAGGLAELQANLTKLTGQLANEPQPGSFSRKPATGCASAIQTDC